MVQSVVVFLVFALALAYLGSIIWKQFAGKKDCGGGCSGCSSIDIAEVEKQLKKNPAFKK